MHESGQTAPSYAVCLTGLAFNDQSVF